MTKFMWDSIIGYFIGCAICGLLTITLFNIGLKEQTAILVACFGWIGGSSVWYANFVNRNKKEDMKKIEEVLKSKADVSSIFQINCILQELKDNYKDQLNNLKDMNKVINQIYKEMPKND